MVQSLVPNPAFNPQAIINCPIYFTLDIIRRKWAVSIILVLFHHSMPVRFNQLERLLTPITQKELTKRLRELEGVGIITRRVYAEVPPRVEYTLTERGRDLVPALKALYAWGDKHGTNNDEATT
jgi:DNA-binding HxlR family transcriptional regulator